MWKQALTSGGIVLAFGSAALADGWATSIGTLSVRSGPGSGYSVVGSIPAHSAVSVSGCLGGTNWCAVQFGGREGWSDRSQLTNWWSGPFGASAGIRSYSTADLETYERAVPIAGAAGPTGVFAATGPQYDPSGSSFFPGSQYQYGGLINGQSAIIDPAGGSIYVRQPH